jgi:hypothetical protein
MLGAYNVECNNHFLEHKTVDHSKYLKLQESVHMMPVEDLPNRFKILFRFSNRTRKGNMYYIFYFIWRNKTKTVVDRVYTKFKEE